MGTTSKTFSVVKSYVELGNQKITGIGIGYGFTSQTIMVQTNCYEQVMQDSVSEPAYALREL